VITLSVYIPSCNKDHILLVTPTDKNEDISSLSRPDKMRTTDSGNACITADLYHE